MIGAEQIIAHLIGDYVLQSSWMSALKKTSTSVALVHAFCYTVPFVALTRSALALAVIMLTHALIDRFRVARIVVWLKEHLSPPALWGTLEFTETGYGDEVPPFLSVWLLIIADNVLHLLINALALEKL